MARELKCAFTQFQGLLSVSTTQRIESDTVTVDLAGEPPFLANPPKGGDLTMLGRGKHGAPFRRRALVEAATAVFAEKGYDCATTREIAERSGSSEGLIHRYFGGKHGLLLAILGSKADDVMGQSAAAMPLRATLGDELEQLLCWPLELFWEQRDFMRVCVSQSAIDPEVGRMIGDRLNGMRVAFITERLQAHQMAGRIRRDVDVAGVALCISGLNISMGFFGQVVFEMDRGHAREIAAEMARVIAAGLAGDDCAISPGRQASAADATFRASERRQLHETP
jgi:AcrR family transcriptional regulator